MIDWDLFRDIRKDGGCWENLSIGHKTPPEIGSMDSKLAHLIEARNGLKERWKQSKLNRRLRRRATEINREIETLRAARESAMGGDVQHGRWANACWGKMEFT
ncbi:hypothetical protein HPB49_014917 [Dermacentor silvarum]|uniref:Uncharacterized protein n=1 Tax=Dermacentor silvarum TaxID=543639 RepID=A0ACB8E1C3_DERSI|nr:hypothetical protein HPB49_014917 [Dermacentor silvarum]